MTEFRLDIKNQTLGTTDAKLRARINEIFNKHALDAVDELQRNTPIGATGDLKRGWDILPAKRSTIGFETSVPIINKAPNAINRIVGRGPGKFPPEAPIQAWVQTKVKPPANEVKSATFLIRRSIARRGTKRWRDGENWAGLDRKGNPTPNSPVSKAEKAIAAELQALNLD